MTKDDEDFIIWIANRLVFKYRENSLILDRIKFILEKNRTITKVLDDNNILMVKGLDETIKYLDSIRQTNKTNIKTLSTKFTEIKIDIGNEILSNMNIDNLLKGV